MKARLRRYRVAAHRHVGTAGLNSGTHVERVAVQRAHHHPIVSQPVGQPIFKLSFFRRGCRLCRRPLAAALVRAKSSCFGEAEADFGR